MALTSEYNIVVFWDYERVGNGDRQIPTSSLNVIEKCKVAVIVISRQYLNSRWCRQELEKITDCCRIEDGLTVVPFFYDGLYPSKGRLQRGTFEGYAFHDFVDGISMETETSREEDNFMSWVAAVSAKASKYSGSRYSVQKSLHG